jgi:hypothetical protein
MPRVNSQDVKPRGVKRGDPKTPGSGRKAAGSAPCRVLKSGRVSQEVADILATYGSTDGEQIERAIRDLSPALNVRND